MSLSRPRRFDREVGMRKSARIFCNTWIYLAVHENIQEWWPGDSRSKVHTRQGKRRSLPATSSLFASTGSHVWSHLAQRNWRDLVSTGHVAPLISLYCPMEFQAQVRCAALLSSSTCWAILSIYVYWRWAKWTKICPNFFRIEVVKFTLVLNFLQVSARVFYGRYQKISFKIWTTHIMKANLVYSLHLSLSLCLLCVLEHATSSLGATHMFCKIMNVGLCWIVWAIPIQMFSARIIQQEASCKNTLPYNNSHSY